jgi:5-methylcytosine-specific restriction endonuclease McrA
LLEQALGRDGWRCQEYGSSKKLQVHHKTFRSRLGSGSEENIIILCVECNHAEHEFRNDHRSRPKSEQVLFCMYPLLKVDGAHLESGKNGSRDL